MDSALFQHPNNSFCKFKKTTILSFCSLLNVMDFKIELLLSPASTTTERRPQAIARWHQAKYGKLAEIS